MSHLYFLFVCLFHEPVPGLPNVTELCFYMVGSVFIPSLFVSKRCLHKLFLFTWDCRQWPWNRENLLIYKEFTVSVSFAQFQLPRTENYWELIKNKEFCLFFLDLSLQCFPYKAVEDCQIVVKIIYLLCASKSYLWSFFHSFLSMLNTLKLHLFLSFCFDKNLRSFMQVADFKVMPLFFLQLSILNIRKRFSLYKMCLSGCDSFVSVYIIKLLFTNVSVSSG